jgi:hypothetical protein
MYKPQRDMKIIQHDGEAWAVCGEGRTDDEGRTYCHLVSMTRGRHQKNGWYPVQIGDWVPTETLSAAA